MLVFPLICALPGCFAPHAYTSARPLGPGRVVGTLSYEPVTIFTRAASSEGPSSARLAIAYPLASSLHLRVGLTEACDFGFHLLQGALPGADGKCTLVKNERFAFAVMPRAQVANELGRGVAFLHGVGLASVDVSEGFRVSPSAGVAGLVGNGTLRWPMAQGDSGRFDGFYARAGLGLELHHAWFSFQPEFTYLVQLRSAPMHGVFAGVALHFGAIP